MNRWILYPLLTAAGLAVGHLAGGIGQEAPAQPGRTTTPLEPAPTWRPTEREQLKAVIRELEAKLAMIDSTDRQEGKRVPPKAPDPDSPPEPPEPGHSLPLGQASPPAENGTGSPAVGEPPAPTPEIPGLEGMPPMFRQMAGQLASAVQSEPVDPDWAHTAADRITTAWYTHDPPPGTAIDSIECRTSVCRLRITGADGVEWEEFGGYLQSLRGKSGDALYTLSWVDDETGEATIYFRRHPVPGS